MTKFIDLGMKKTLLAALLASLSPAVLAVNIGAVLPLTGSSASIGDDQKRGIELALEKINAAGGVLGEPFKVIVEDSGGVASTAVSSAKKLIDVDKVPIIMGEYSSGITIPVAQYVLGENAAHINIGSSSPRIRDLPDGQFSLIGLDDVSSKFAAQDLIDMGFKTAAFIAPNNAYGQGVQEHLSKAFEAAGGKMTASLLYTEGQSTYRRELQQLARAKPDVYVYSAYGQEASVMNREAYDLGLNSSPWYAIYLTMCTTDTPAQAAQGQIGLEINAVGPREENFIRDYETRFGESLRSTFSGYAYDAVMLAAKAIERAGSADRSAIRKAIAEEGQGFDGVTGRIVFDADGQRSEQPYARVRYDDGKVVPR